MFECEECGHRIDGRTDDNYNREHTKIQCPECGHWQSGILDSDGEEGFMIMICLAGCRPIGPKKIDWPPDKNARSTEKKLASPDKLM